jgi:hypothetical protein
MTTKKGKNTKIGKLTLPLHLLIHQGLLSLQCSSGPFFPHSFYLSSASLKTSPWWVRQRVLSGWMFSLEAKSKCSISNASNLILCLEMRSAVCFEGFYSSNPRSCLGYHPGSERSMFSWSTLCRTVVTPAFCP